MKTAALLLILFTLFMLNTFAQDSPQWHLPDGAKARFGKGIISGNIAHSPDGARLAVASAIGIWLYDTATHQESALLTGHGREVESLAFSPDGNTTASGGWNDMVCLWNTTTGAHQHTITGYTGSVSSVAYSPDGNTIASGSRGTRLWDATTGAYKHTLTGHTHSVASIAFSPDGNAIASGSRDGTGLLWELTPDTPVESAQLAEDVNNDGMVNIFDLVLVAGQFGQSGENRADINGDGVVNVQDLVLVAGVFGNAAAAPSLHPQALARLTTTEVEGWLTQARQMGLTTPGYLRGIAVLEQLLAALTPPETVLLPNYPNPLNPETWIPYHLAHAADVQVTVYDAKGAIVRQLDLGYQSVGYYTARSKAAYWNGRNDTGELVASGVYFYQLRAGDYTAMKRLAIVK